MTTSNTHNQGIAHLSTIAGGRPFCGARRAHIVVAVADAANWPRLCAKCQKRLAPRPKASIAKAIPIVLAAAALILPGCAGRPPAPVAVVQAQDRALDCTQVSAEVQANSAKIAALGREEGGKAAQNVAAGVVGLFFFPAFALMDLQGSAAKETAALQSRNQYLASLASEKRCGVQ